MKNSTMGDASEYQYAATIPSQIQITSGTIVEVTQNEQPIVPNAITFGEAQNLNENEYFSKF